MVGKTVERNLEEVKPEEIDPSFRDRTKTTAREGIAPVAGALVGVGVGLGISRSINTFAASQPVANRDWAHYGLKGVAILGALVEMGLSTTMDSGKGKTAAMVGGATFVATETLEIIQDAATQAQWKIPFLQSKECCDGKNPAQMPPIQQQPTGIQRQNASGPNFRAMAAVPL
jgi:hypothetical protein